MTIYEKAVENEKNTASKALFMVTIMAAAVMFLFPVAILHAEGRVQTASTDQYVNPPVPEGNNSMPDGIDAASCEMYGAIPAVVEGPADLEFWWRGSENGVIIFTDNGKIAAVQYKDSGWQKYKYTIRGSGTHVIKWAYKAVDANLASNVNVEPNNI
jgi:hypothetical protein